jgi:hypothetical protein
VIHELAASSHEEKREALERNIRAVTPLHEAGHALMMGRWRVRSSIFLPSVQLKGDVYDINENAGAQLRIGKLGPDAIADICFGGICAELALYDGQILQSGSAKIFVNYIRSANDCISFIQTADVPDASVFDVALRSGGDRAGTAVHKLLKLYGMATYRKVYDARDELFALADELYSYWEANRFQKCMWKSR